MPPKSKLRSMTTDACKDGATISETPTKYCRGMYSQTKFKSMANLMQTENISIPAIVSQKRSALPGISSQTKFKSMTNCLQNESVSVPAISQNRSPLGPLSENRLQMRSKRVTTVVHNDSTSMPNIISQKGCASSRLAAKKRCLPNEPSIQRAEISIDNEAENLQETLVANRSALSGIPSLTKFKSMTNYPQNESVIVPTIISQNRSPLGPISGNRLQMRSKRVTAAVHNDSTSNLEESLVANRSALSGIPSQRKFKSMTNCLQNESVSVPTIIAQNRSSLGPFSVKERYLPNEQSTQRAEISIDNEAENLDEGPVGNIAHEQSFHPSIEVDERDSDDVVESNSTNVQAASTSISKLRKTRGPSQKTTFEPPQGTKWTCMLIRGQPVGEPASKLAGTLGLYARNESYFCPYKKWKEQSMQSFNDVMNEIMVHFEFVNQEGIPANMEDVNRFCFRSIQIKLKEWRCQLKRKGLMKGENGELSMEPPEHRITQASWNHLVQYWATEEKVCESERNKNNRAQEQATHTLGAKSIARHNQEQREKLGDNFTTIGAYIKAHQSKSGDYPNEHTRYICDRVIEICQDKDVMNSSDPTILSPILDGVCNGHHGGYERGCGLGWSRINVTLG